MQLGQGGPEEHGLVVRMCYDLDFSSAVDILEQIELTSLKEQTSLHGVCSNKEAIHHMSAFRAYPYKKKKVATSDCHERPTPHVGAAPVQRHQSVVAQSPLGG